MILVGGGYFALAGAARGLCSEAAQPPGPPQFFICFRLYSTLGYTRKLTFPFTHILKDQVPMQAPVASPMHYGRYEADDVPFPT